MKRLRDYQRKDIANIRAALGKHRRVLFVGCTAQGKTVEVSELIRKWDGRVRVLTPTRETALQWVAELADRGVKAGLILAGYTEDRSLRVQVGTVATGHNRKSTRSSLLVIDEAQHCPAPTWREIAKGYGKILGLTGSPWRYDGIALGQHFDTLVAGPTPQWLVEHNWISSPVAYTWNLGFVLPVAEDKAEYGSATVTRVRRHVLVGDVFDHRQKHAKKLPTIGFACTINHAKELADGFSMRGVAARYISARTPRRERAETLLAFKNGTVKALFTVGVLAEGWDMPEARCLIMARPIASRALFIQQCGRVERPGSRAIILDHAGNIHRHGHPIDHAALFPWSLDGKAGIVASHKATVRTCPHCGCTLSRDERREKCPWCGGPLDMVLIDRLAGELVPMEYMSDAVLWEYLKARERARVAAHE